MGVTIRKKAGKWYVFVNYHGRRKAKCIGDSKAAAIEVKRVLEAKLALGDIGFLNAGDQVPTFELYAQGWLETHAEVECKRSTKRSYEQLLRLHVTPHFGTKRLTDISRDEVKAFIADLAKQTKLVDDKPVLKFSRNTLRLIICALRGVLSSAVDDGLITANPAAKVGRFAKTEKPNRQASAMTREEVEKFLAAVQEISPDWYPFFLTAVRAGLRRGELIGLKWGDIQFGRDANDSNRYILVQNNYVSGSFTTPKSKKTRRVDLSKQLRGILLELRDTRLLEAMMVGRASIADDLVFPCSTWDEDEKVWRHGRGSEPLKPDNIATRYFEPALAKAGLRRFTLHDLRHTFGSLLIQDGASLAYVRDQMGHSSIQITVDIYGHLVPGANISWVDRLDDAPSQTAPTTPQQNATQVQPEPDRAENVLEKEIAEVIEMAGEETWLPPRDSNPDMLIQSQLSCR
jgi:integrase